MSKAKFISAVQKAAVYISAALTMGVLLMLIVYVLGKGIPNLKPSLFAAEYNSKNVSMLPAIINTLIMTGLSLLIAVPLGVGAAVYLVEYAKRGSKLVSLVRLTAETLAGIPSIVYGLFGFLMLVIALKLNYSLLSGSLTLAIMILPLIMRTTEEALKSVPDLYREGSFGLGAGKLRTIVKIILPAAMPGILAGIILAVGRIVGETVALMYTAGTYAAVPTKLVNGTKMLDLLGSGRTLSVHMYSLLSEGLHTKEAYAAGAILLVVVLCINSVSALIARMIGNVTK